MQRIEYCLSEENTVKADNPASAYPSLGGDGESHPAEAVGRETLPELFF